MNPQSVFVPVGYTVNQCKPGDFILTHGTEWQAQMIQFGQRRRFKGDDAPYAYYNHAAFVADPNGTLIEALADGVRQTHISRYTQSQYTLVTVQGLAEDRLQALAFAQSAVGRDYGWFQAAAIGLSLLSGLQFSFGFDEQMICSTLVAGALERMGILLPRPCTSMTPADLAKLFSVRMVANG